MLSGSTLLRVVVLFVAAAALAGLVQAFWPQGADAPPPAPTVQRTEPDQGQPTENRSDCAATSRGTGTRRPAGSPTGLRPATLGRSGRCPGSPRRPARRKERGIPH